MKLKTKVILVLLDLVGAVSSAAYFYSGDTQSIALMAFIAYLATLVLLSLRGFYSFGLRFINHFSLGPMAGCFLLTSFLIGLFSATLQDALHIFCVNMTFFLASRIVTVFFSDLSKLHYEDLSRVYIYGLTSHSLVHYDLISRTGVYWSPAIVCDRPSLIPFSGRTMTEATFVSIAKKSKLKIEVHVAPECFENFCKLLPSLPTNVKHYKILEASQHIAQISKRLPVEFSDLNLQNFLNRPKLGNSSVLMDGFFDKKEILVTGGAGSIGSEIVRQLLNYDIKKVIVLDSSEFSLFGLSKEMESDSRVDLKLCSATDYSLVDSVFSTNNIDLIFHAAAYKHVPLVEQFKLSGLRNNVLATNNICKLAVKYGAQNFCLISTDKAVRPTNVMGASKRLCEILVSFYSQKSDVIFSAVRFGNVLGSSGSVVPLFLSQINSGGPVTLTHKEITRYFMSIPEAAGLVLMSTKIAKTGELFLLDMGEPVKIYDLAVSLIHACGFKVAGANDNDGDSIEIIESGLRPGEKLYEELLLSGSPLATQHPKIFKTLENVEKTGQLDDLLSDLDKLSLDSGDDEISRFLLNYVEGYSIE